MRDGLPGFLPGAPLLNSRSISELRLSDVDLKDDNTAETKWSYDPGTGLPVDTWDPVAVKNGTASTHDTLNTTDDADPTLSGHVGFVDDITTPLGNRTHYSYYGLSSSDPNYVSTPGYAGNLYTVQAPDGTVQGARRTRI